MKPIHINHNVSNPVVEVLVIIFFKFAYMKRKWLVRVLKLFLYFVIWFVITTIGAFYNKFAEISSIPIPPLFLFSSFVIPYYICYSKWSKRNIWNRKSNL